MTEAAVVSDAEVVTIAARAWQDALVTTVVARLGSRQLDGFRALYSPRAFNMDFGVRVNYGRRAGHSTVARRLLNQFDGSVLVVPTTNAPPFADEARHAAELKREGREDLIERIWPSRPLDIVSIDGSGLTRQDVIEKTFAPLKGASICIVDAASRLSEDELEILRATSWRAYVELG